MRNVLIALFPTALCISTVAAQPIGTGTYVADIKYGSGGAVTPSEPVVTLRLHVERSAGYALALSYFDLTASDGAFTFVDYGMMQDESWGASQSTSGSSLAVNAIQWNTPSPFPLFYHALTDNPIHILTCTWTTSDFTERDVLLHTLTSQMAAYLGSGYNLGFASAPLTPIELSSTIHVVPSPSPVALISFCTCSWSLRRRREPAIS
ncbi:MAG: hypothetical protein H6815_04195 [Phycisphaeraceae bacterium]|nr:hypothetical protein [Phycisphaerales bacterium]MCB9859632.1 hypothetical protein [Phycisphaeraceae bacterium]